MIRKALTLLALSAALLPGSSLATVIDFNPTSDLYGPTYSQDGFTIAYNYNDPERPYNQIDGSRAFTNWLKRTAPSYNANGDNPTIADNYAYMTDIIYAIDGSIFSFEGVSLADTLNLAYGGNAEIIFNYAAGGSKSLFVTLQRVKGLQEFSFSEKGLLSVAFRGSSTNLNTLQFDFIKVNSSLASSVPEPSTWALMLIGFGIIGYAARRTRRPSMRMQVV